MDTPRRFDDPTARFYDPARRTWVILSGCCPNRELLDRDFFYEWGQTWDDMLVDELMLGAPEAQAIRTVLARAIDCYPD